MPATRARAALLVVSVLTGCTTTPSPSPTSLTAPTSTPRPTPVASSLASPVGSPVAVAAPGQTWEETLLSFEPIGLAGFRGFTGVTSTRAGILGWGPRLVTAAEAAQSGPQGVRAGSGSELMLANGQADSASLAAGWTSDLVLEGDRIVAAADGPAGIVLVGEDSRKVSHAWGLWHDNPSDIVVLGEIPGQPQAISAFSGRYVAVGAAARGCLLEAWTSEDGFGWTNDETQLPVPSTACDPTGSEVEGPVGPRVDFLVSDGTTLLALGAIPGLGQATWTSTDATRWQLTPLPDLQGAIFGVAAGRAGFVAVGSAAPTSDGVDLAGVWTSADGATWRAVPSQPSLQGARMLSVTARMGGGFVAVGSIAGPNIGVHGGFAAWTSDDGLTWQRASEPFCDSQIWSCPLGGDPTLVAATSGTVMALGGGIAAWVSPLRPTLHRAVLEISTGNPSITVAGQCVDQTDPVTTEAIDVSAAWREPSDDGNLSPEGDGSRHVDIMLAADGTVVSFMYIDPLGRTYVAPSEPNGVALRGFANSLTEIAVGAGSTPRNGRLTFTGLLGYLPDFDAGHRDGPPVSGSIAWTCAA